MRECELRGWWASPARQAPRTPARCCAGWLAAGEPVDLVVSRAARLTLLDETGEAWRDDPEQVADWLGLDRRPTSGSGPPADLAAGPSSGSYPARGMVVVPASTEAVAGIALGLSKDLLQRSAAVTLKEGRPLVVVPREMPLARRHPRAPAGPARRRRDRGPGQPRFLRRSQGRGSPRRLRGGKGAGRRRHRLAMRAGQSLERSAR